MIFNVYGLNKYFKVYKKYLHVYLKNRVDVFWDELNRSLQKCVQNQEKGLWKKLEEAWEEIHFEILLKLNGRMPRLFLAFIFAQRYKIRYMQFGKVFDT